MSLEIITGVATSAVGTLIAAVLAWWVYVRQRELPYWILVGFGGGGSATDLMTASIRVANAGNGGAFAVRVEGLHCVARIQAAEEAGHEVDFGPNAVRVVVPSVLTGASIVVHAQFRERDWNRAKLKLSWVQDTSRKSPRRERVEWPLAQFQDFEASLASIGEAPLA